MRINIPWLNRKNKCDGCQCEESGTITLTPEVKHFGRSSLQMFFCSDQCKQDYYQEHIMHNIRAAGL